MRENHYAISCIGLKISYVFKSQDKHNASLFFQNVVTGLLPIGHKVTTFYDSRQ